LEWAQVRALVADGVSERDIARRLGINRRTVARLAQSEDPPRYWRAPVASKLDPFEPMLRRLLEDWPQISCEGGRATQAWEPERLTPSTRQVGMRMFGIFLPNAWSCRLSSCDYQDRGLRQARSGGAWPDRSGVEAARPFG
jgi:hypothetical protein